MDTKQLIADCVAVLKTNDRGTHTIPAEGLYPHQWLWDSCFIAIGLRHVDIEQAKTEVLSLLGGQWQNGMVPHMIFSGDDLFRRDRNVWRSWLSPYAPDHVATSGITQPPMLAEAIVSIGNKLPVTERRSWYQQTYPALLRFHQWLMTDRDPHGEGLALLVHPYECGLDNTPPWVHQLRTHHMPWWAKLIESTHLDALINIVRRDTRHAPPGTRISNTDALLYYTWVRRLRKRRYDISDILNDASLAIEDVTFNCILIRANEHLHDIAQTIGQDLPAELSAHAQKARQALDELWDQYAAQYYSRDFVTHKLIKQPSLATLMPLYSRAITKERAAALVKQLEDEQLFGSNYPVPSVPLNSSWYQPLMYWQGPTWVNTNWLIIDGLRHYGYNDHADALVESTVELVQRSGCYEYFSPQDGAPAGAHNFSWTAALVIDLLQPKKPRQK